MPHRTRVLITRTRHQASELALRLDALGFETILIPTIELSPPTSYEPLDSALTDLRTFEWLLFTSANAVKALRDRAQQLGTALHPKRIAVIGPATLKAVTNANIVANNGPILMPDVYVAEALAADLLDAVQSPSHFLLIRAEDARDIIPAALEAGGHHVTIAPAYRNIVPPGTIPALQALFASPETHPDVITFTSSSTARNLFALLESAGIALPPGLMLASIGPITSDTLRELGYPPTLEAAEPTIDSLTAALKLHLS